jgi:hypothetical protein
LYSFICTRSLLISFLSAATSVTFAGQLYAQSTPAQHNQRRARSTANANAETTASRRSTSSPGTFRELSVRQDATQVGTGAASATESTPSSQDLRGPTAPAPDEITGPIGPGDAARLIQAQMPRLRPCYEQARTTHPDLAGRIEVRLTIDRNGRVTRSIATGMPEAPEVATCMADTLRQTMFPRPENGSLQFIYPLNFVPPEPPARGHGRRRATVGPNTASRPTRLTSR